MKNSVLVTGDAAIDWYEVILPPDSGISDETGYNWKRSNKVARTPALGGSLLLAEILRHEIEDVTGPVLRCGTDKINAITPEQMIYSEAQISADKNNRYYIKQMKGYSGPAGGGRPVCLLPGNDILEYPADAGGCGIVVIDDAGNGFRDEDAFFPKGINNDTIVIYKMHSPIGSGRCWDTWLPEVNPDNLVVVVYADDLRKIPEVNISRSLSWERTTKDFIWNIMLQKNLEKLKKCVNLIVLFDNDGAILFRGNDTVNSSLIFDAKRLEGGFTLENKKTMMCQMSVFTAVLVKEIIKNSGLAALEDNIKEGLRAIRAMELLGYNADGGRISLPLKKILSCGSDPDLSKKCGRYAEVVIPLPADLGSTDPGFWRILDQKTKNTRQLISESILLKGSHGILDGVPEIRFGKSLTTLDRSEIENYSGLRNLIIEYLDSPFPGQPLNIAVFGSPGAGKSFGVKQIANFVAPDRFDFITNNMSQYSSYDEFVSALHKVRNSGLSGRVPFVFFDEFDSQFQGSRLGWLKTYLAPMQDGEFFDGKTNYNIGKAIFVFAGGTSHSFQSFIAPLNRGSDPVLVEEFKRAKGPDFVSRLKGFINIMGPNPAEIASGTDEAYIIRRSKVMRSLFESSNKASGLFDNNKKLLNIDPGVLRAVLLVPEYRHGNRSIVSLIEMSNLMGRKIFDKAALPPKEQLDLHVDAETFFFLMEKERFTGSIAGEKEITEKIARGIHNEFVQIRKGRGISISVPESFDDLSENKKTSNYDAAGDIPGKFRSIGIGVRQAASESYSRTPIITEQELEKLAEMEHARYCREQTVQGWAYAPGEYDPVKKTNPNLVAYASLTEEMKEELRDSIRSLPTILASVNIELYRMEETNQFEDQGLIVQLARQIHEDYLEKRKREGVPESDPSMRSFDELPDDLKFSNLNNAAHIPTKLKAINYGIRRIKKGTTPQVLKLTEDQVEMMSRLEHDRWNIERSLSGWTYRDGEKDERRKTTPYLVPYDRLPEKIREYDREMVRLIPELLTRAGYEAYKLK